MAKSKQKYQKAISSFNSGWSSVTSYLKQEEESRKLAATSTGAPRKKTFIGDKSKGRSTPQGGGSN